MHVGLVTRFDHTHTLFANVEKEREIANDNLKKKNVMLTDYLLSKLSCGTWGKKLYLK